MINPRLKVPLDVSVQGVERHYQMHHFERRSRRARSSMKCLHQPLFWSRGTVINDMSQLFFAIMAKLLIATTNMSKLFARKTWNLLYITAFTTTLDNISNCHKFWKGNIVRDGSLVKQTLFLPWKSLTQVSKEETEFLFSKAPLIISNFEWRFKRKLIPRLNR